MAISPFKLHENYWQLFNIESKDLEFLYNHLLELETPLTTKELIDALVKERINIEKQALQNRQLSDGKVYIPMEHYQVGQTLIFPTLGWKKGKVINVRSGNNPEAVPFDVIELEMEKGLKRQFAAGLAEHKLNRPIEINLDDPMLDHTKVMQQFGDQLAERLDEDLNGNPDLVRIAGSWFPKALLVDVNIGHLNLAEAALDMSGGGPLTTRNLLDQIDLQTDVNSKLTEFSLNYFLQEDQRFDEVGPSGEVVWFLHRLEPEGVRQLPHYLHYSPIDIPPVNLSDGLITLEHQLDDSSTVQYDEGIKVTEAVVSLIYPHWRVGTLPLSSRTISLFPTALESPRIRFTLVDSDTGEKFPGWVVRPYHYIYGLREWYLSQGLIPGSFVHVRRGKKPGEVLVQAEKRRSNREWIRTILVGADGGIVFAMLKQMVNASFDERMAVSIPDVTALDQVWEVSAKQRTPLIDSVLLVMRELTKLNPQGHVHAQELYAALNVIRRCPPAILFNILVTHPKFIHVGDLYYRMDETQQEN